MSVNQDDARPDVIEMGNGVVGGVPAPFIRFWPDADLPAAPGMPEFDRWEDRFELGGRAGTLEYLWVTAEEWAGRPEAGDRAWSTRAVGPFVLATRLTL